LKTSVYYCRNLKRSRFSVFMILW